MFQHIDGIPFLGAALTGLFLLVLIKACVPKVSPVRVIRGLVREHSLSPTFLFYVLMLLGIIFLDILETRFDDVITQHAPRDYTGLVHQIEGSATALFQIVNFQWLTLVLSLVYLYVFPIMGFVCVYGTFYGGERVIARKLFWATIFNYVLILPFYILVPVAERWTVGDGEVALLMNQISPQLLEGLRPFSGLNNCFPSFHTSLALSYALIISQSGNRRLRLTMQVLAGLVCYSTLYLGIHWVLDALAGVAFAGMCSLLATWAVENFKLELHLARTR